MSVARDNRPLAEEEFAERSLADRSLTNRGSNRRQRLFARQVRSQSATNEHNRSQNSEEWLIPLTQVALDVVCREVGRVRSPGRTHDGQGALAFRIPEGIF